MIPLPFARRSGYSRGSSPGQYTKAIRIASKVYGSGQQNQKTAVREILLCAISHTPANALSRLAKHPQQF